MQQQKRVRSANEETEQPYIMLPLLLLLLLLLLPSSLFWYCWCCCCWLCCWCGCCLVVVSVVSLIFLVTIEVESIRVDTRPTGMDNSLDRSAIAVISCYFLFASLSSSSHTVMNKRVKHQIIIIINKRQLPSSPTPKK